jgi:glutathionyl-hydroquinone reductase
METFCLTALEAAATKTLVVTNNLAALQNSVGNRGIIIRGDATTEEWHERALTKLFKIMDSSDNKMKNVLIEANYEWAKDLSWDNRASVLLDRFILKDKLHELPTLARYNFSFSHETDKAVKEDKISLKLNKY